MCKRLSSRLYLYLQDTRQNLILWLQDTFKKLSISSRHFLKLPWQDEGNEGQATVCGQCFEFALTLLAGRQEHPAIKKLCHLPPSLSAGTSRIRKPRWNWLTQINVETGRKKETAVAVCTGASVSKLGTKTCKSLLKSYQSEMGSCRSNSLLILRFALSLPPLSVPEEILWG